MKRNKKYIGSHIQILPDSVTINDHDENVKKIGRLRGNGK